MNPNFFLYTITPDLSLYKFLSHKSKFNSLDYSIAVYDKMLSFEIAELKKRILNKHEQSI